jgi:DeoR/GlpR family transcriptional regulator of sugar metabolism
MSVFTERREQREIAEEALALRQKALAKRVPILDGFLTIKELAADLDVTTRTIRRYLNEADGLPHLRFAGKLLFSPERVRAWILERGEVQRNPTKVNGRTGRQRRQKQEREARGSP